MDGLWRLGCLAPLLLGAGCSDSSRFYCQNDAQCAAAGAGGRCETDNNCSLSDPECPSGRRYADFSGDLSAMCTPVPDGSSDGSASTSDTTPPTLSATTDVSDTSGGPLATGPGPATTTTTTTDPSTTDATTGSTNDGGTTDGTTGDATSGSTGVSPACAVVFEDSFAGLALDPYWGVTNPNAIDLGGGTATFDVGPASRWHALIANGGGFMNLEDSCLTLEVETPPAQHGLAGQLEIASPPNIHMWTLSDGNLQAWAGQGNDPGFLEPFDPVQHRFLGLCVEGGDVVWRYSADGVGWTVAASLPAPAWVADAQIRIVANAWDDLPAADQFELASFTRCEY